MNESIRKPTLGLGRLAALAIGGALLGASAGCNGPESHSHDDAVDAQGADVHSCAGQDGCSGKDGCSGADGCSAAGGEHACASNDGCASKDGCKS